MKANVSAGFKTMIKSLKPTSHKAVARRMKAHSSARLGGAGVTEADMAYLPLSLRKKAAAKA